MVTQSADKATPETSAPLLLVDGSSYLFRAYYALPELTNSANFPTGAIRGVIGMLKKLARDYAGSPIAVVFDAPGKTFRDDFYPEYKANRDAMPEDLRRQIEPIHRIIRAMGLPLLVVPGVEADDVIGTLAAQATREARDTIISTNDKDMAQLVSPHVSLVDTMKDVKFDREGVIAKHGVQPERIVEYLALTGDTVDNIPGIPKVGPKTAAKWLNEYGSLDALIANAAKISGKVGESLREHIHVLSISRQLATIKCDVALEVGVHDLVSAPPDDQLLRTIFSELEFRTWIDELGDAAGPQSISKQTPAQLPAAPARETSYVCITTAEALDEWIDRLQKSVVFAFDTETTSLDYMQAEIVGVSFAVEAGEGAYVPVAHDYLGASQQLERGYVLDKLRPLLEDPQQIKTGQNIKYDMSVLANYGIELRGGAFDTMLESYVLNSVASRHNMDDLAMKYLGVKTTLFEEVAGKGAKQLTFNQVEVGAATQYAAEDADITLRLHQTLWPALSREQHLTAVFRDIEMPLIPVLSRMERHGTRVDGALLKEHSRWIEEQLVRLRGEAWAAAGGEFNLDSPKQLREILFERLGIPVLRKTPGGQPSTAEPVLEELADDYELPRIIMAWRGLAKLKSTYTDKLPLQINPRTGRIHTSYHQAVASTGRLSSSDPNLQNIPIRTAEGRRIRQAFIAPEECRILAADYSQIELRIMAHLSGDASLTAAFASGLDIHRATAGEVFGVGADAVTDDQRRSAKAINFGLIYGMSAFGLARQLGISRTLAADYIERYFARYPGVRAYMDNTRVLAAEQGFVETVFGRRLYLPEISSGNVPRRQAAERTAINAPMQGTAADIIKRAMIRVDEELRNRGVPATMIMQVHDELVFEVERSAVNEVRSMVCEVMQNAAQLDVPLIVDCGEGDNWDEAH
ncbi:MAG: DNA polymerase I [Gammaproteobacteria bacterium]|nr:DNA polymerase I [Gammaproteobacteria bacterium]